MEGRIHDHEARNFFLFTLWEIKFTLFLEFPVLHLLLISLDVFLFIHVSKWICLDGSRTGIMGFGTVHTAQ